jgi:thiol-disulfide isomerase/thioredoxin
MLKRMMSVLCLIAAGVSSNAVAQDEDPNQILNDSRDAISQLEGFKAQLSMFGDGASAIKSMMPSMNGKIFYGDHPKYGKSFRVHGMTTDKQGAAPYSIDILQSKEAMVWTDLTKQTIDEHKAGASVRGAPTALSLIMFDMMLQDDPYGERMELAESLTLDPQTEVHGVMCHVVHVRYAKPVANGGSRNSKHSHSEAKWFIGVEDHLPRRIEHLTTGLMKFQLVAELKNLVIEAPSDEEIDVMRLEHFKLKSTLNPPERSPIESRDPDPVPDTNEVTEPATPTDPSARLDRAPGFEFTDVSGAKITNATQSGRVTVLYFNGSWCLPCRDTTPLVSSLAESFASQDVDVFGLAIRERDEVGVQLAFDGNGYSHRLVTGVDKLPERFKVWLYPTVVVINKSGEMSFRGNLTKEMDAQKLIDAVGMSVKEAIAS